MGIKTKSLSKKALNHLKSIGYILDDTLGVLSDSPFLLFSDKTIHACYSVNEFRNFDGQLRNENQILKLRPATEKSEVSKLSKNEKTFYKLLTLLNNRKNSKMTGYDVSWSIQANKTFNTLEIFPISQYSCGNISMKHLELVLEFAKQNNINIRFSYTDVFDENKKYRTYTPCIVLS